MDLTIDFKILMAEGVEGKKKKFELSETFCCGNVYNIPERATHIHLRGGKLAFGFSSSMKGDRRTKRGRFVMIPQGNYKAVHFPNYCFPASGHYYGAPEWY
ncbi:MAG: hypothetical protein AAB789_01150 [Patescibacteria group bacterium]